ncbi:MAG: hypothetical protein GY859_39415, partial [Desulfobacterales bacterium]|nr:hypothetical protein [Desulfobacterales bacterium]
LKKRYREYESEEKANAPRIQKSRNQLRTVKNNKEYQALLKEIEEFQVKHSRFEDLMLECLEQIDGAEESVEEKRKEYAERSERITAKGESIREKAERAEKKLAALDKELKSLEASSEPQIFKKFNLVKGQQPDRMAIVPVQNAVCGGCNMNIPPQLYNELQRNDEMRFCPLCQRIIFWRKPEPEPPAEEEKRKAGKRGKAGGR